MASTLIHPDSKETLTAELDLFKTASTDTSISNGYYEQILPTNAISNANYINFNIPGSGDDYIDLKNSYLSIKGRFLNEDGSVMNRFNSFAPVNFLLHALFNKVDVSLNGKTISHSNPYYFYRAYIESLLGYNNETEMLRLAMWEKDTAHKFNELYMLWIDDIQAAAKELNEKSDSSDEESVDEPSSKEKRTKRDDDGQKYTPIEKDVALNLGAYKRYQKVRESKMVELIGPIFADIFLQRKFLLNMVSVNLTLYRSQPDIYVQTISDAVKKEIRPKFQIESASFFVRKVKPSQSVFVAHQEVIQKGPAIYPMQYVAVKVFDIPAGMHEGNRENLFMGQLPTRVALAFVKSKSLHGDFPTNPFNFEHFDISQICLRANGQAIPAVPIKTNFENQNYSEAFAQLFLASSKTFGNSSGMITEDDFAGGFALFMFHLSPLMGHTENYAYKKQGILQADVHFGKKTPESISMIVVGYFDSFISVNQNRDIYSLV